ncbi:MAG: methylenetetrahydrofolate reductase C-terminal domain-containing protein [Deltaproteobacteria bacterium]|nr:methylenetetrahydrofolate reductase C-terminal domain-containing protein [Deltaproteobacteria bacterium]
MIVGEQKPFEQIVKLIERYRRVLVAGCGTCVSVCFAGGEKEAGILASMLRLEAQKNGRPLEVLEQTVKRQCDMEFLEEMTTKVGQVDAVLSIACGCGIQFMAERFQDKIILPGLNTKFIGVTLEQGEWAERCAMCGDCILDRTGGVCPVARCAKRLHNGPCGGSSGGKCEVGKDRDCGWALIVQRLQKLGELERYAEIIPPRNWTTSRDGGQRKVVREDLKEQGRIEPR